MSARIRIAICLLVVAFTFLAGPAQAKYLGGVRPFKACKSCGATSCPVSSSCAPRNAGSGTSTSLSEGNLIETYAGPSIAGGSGAAVSLDLSYNSNLADGSNGRVNTVLGVGWTHRYNVFLFKQRSEMFRFEGNGRVNKFTPKTSTSYRSTEGYFTTLHRTTTGFTLQFKDGASQEFALVPGSPTLDGQQVYWLQRVADRIGNTTTLAYTGGLLTSITNTYGRSLTLAYNAGRKLASITDPLARVTTLQYDATNTRLQRIVDPTGKAVNYTSNALYQITRKVDKDGRSFTFGYKVDKPVSVTDGAGASLFTQTNTTNWATDSTALATKLMRVYIPSTTSRKDGNGNIWQYDYDAGGYITLVRAPDGAETRYTYDAVTLNVESMTDANGNTTHYKYDAQGNLIKQTDALGHITSWTYEPVFNQMTSMKDPNLRETIYDIDPANGNRLKETDPLGGTLEWRYDSHGNVLTEKDKNGNVTSYDYDGSGNRVKITDALLPIPNVTTMTYDAVGNMISRTNARGFTTSYQYDGLNRLVNEIRPVGDPLQADTSFFYDGQGNRVEVIDRNDNSTTYQYDLRQRLVKSTDALGQTMKYTYDGNDNRSSATDKNNHTTYFEYDVQNRLVKTTDAIGNMTTMTYDGVGNRLTETDANGHTTTYQYDALNRRVSSLDAEDNLTQLEYDRVGMTVPSPLCPGITGPTRGSSLVTRQIDANNKYTYFKYDGLDRLVCQIRKQTDTADAIDSDDAVTRYSYDAQGNRLTMTEPNGNTMTYTYDALNRQVKVVNAAGDTTRMTYDPNSNVETITAPNLNVTTYTYDALDRVTQVDDSEGLVATYTYDNVGNRKTQKDGNGNGTINTYDAIYRITEVTDALGKTTHYDYDPVGNLLKTTDREGRVTTYVYDDINRRIEMIDAQPFRTTYEYDGVGNLKKIKAFNDTEDTLDPPQITSYHYDKVNRLITETYPDAVPNTRSFTYDRVSNLKTRTDQKAQVTNYRYDDLYRLRVRDYPGSGHDDTFDYDLSGRMLRACRDGAVDDVPVDGCAGWLVTFTYDDANRVKTTTQNGKTLAYSYDIPGRTRSVTYPGGRSIVEATDARSRLGKIDDAGSPPPIVQYRYDLGNRVVSRVYRNGTAANYGYNDNNWITSLNHVRSDLTQIAGFTHDHDNEGNKRFENKSHDPGASEAFAYDNVYRLIDFKVGNVVGSTVPVPTTQTQYTLDNVGNWKVKTKDAIPETRTHNAVNEITSINGAPVLSDPNGNTSENTRYSYAYDEENRLTVVTRKSDGRVVGQYHYDALSRRIRKIADAATPSIPVETRYFYDGARIVEEQSPVGTMLATYVYGNYIDEILTMERGGQTYYYHQNALWSVEAITNSAAAVVERYSYDAYGLPVVSDGSGTVGVPVAPNAWGTPHSAIGNPWMFTGRQLDEETGIYFYRARYYDGVKGRFLQRDPLGYVDGMNLYSYVRDNPISHVDPWGLKICVPKLISGKAYGDFYAAGTLDVIGILATAIPDDSSLRLRNHTAGNAYYVLWARWGAVDLTTETEIRCSGENEKCHVTVSTTGASDGIDSVISAVIAMKEQKNSEGDCVEIAAAAAGALAAGSGPSITVGKEDVLSVGISYESAARQRTLQLGTFKWCCRC